MEWIFVGIVVLIVGAYLGIGLLALLGFLIAVAGLFYGFVRPRYYR